MDTCSLNQSNYNCVITADFQGGKQSNDFVLRFYIHLLIKLMQGYLCCKRRVLEFEEFLKIKGCQIGRHCFVPVVVNPKVSTCARCSSLLSDFWTKTEEQIECRIDHYQTPGQVHVSVFAKQIDKEHSTVQFEESKVTCGLLDID